MIGPRFRRRWLVIVALAALGLAGLAPGIAEACSCNAATPFRESAAGRYLTSHGAARPTMTRSVRGPRSMRAGEALSGLGAGLMVISIIGGSLVIRRASRRLEFEA